MCERESARARESERERERKRERERERERESATNSGLVHLLCKDSITKILKSQGRSAYSIYSMYIIVYIVYIFTAGSAFENVCRELSARTQCVNSVRELSA